MNVIVHENAVDEQFRLENCLAENRRILPESCVAELC